jgi:predicted peroxiredoxin
LISDEHRDFAVTAATTLLTSLNAASANWEVAVFSRKQGAAGNRKVTGIEIGRVLDTQRRRRRSLAEGYAS